MVAVNSDNPLTSVIKKPIFTMQLSKIKYEINRYSNINNLDYYLYTDGRNTSNYKIEIIKVNAFKHSEKSVIYIPFTTLYGNIKVTEMI